MGNGGIALELAHSLRGVEVGLVLGVCSMVGAHHFCLGPAMCRGHWHQAVQLLSSGELLLCRLCFMTESHGCFGPGRNQATPSGTLLATAPSPAGEPGQLDRCLFLAQLQGFWVIWAALFRTVQADRGPHWPDSCLLLAEVQVVWAVKHAHVGDAFFDLDAAQFLLTQMPHIQPGHGQSGDSTAWQQHSGASAKEGTGGSKASSEQPAAGQAADQEAGSSSTWGQQPSAGSASGLPERDSTEQAEVQTVYCWQSPDAARCLAVAVSLQECALPCMMSQHAISTAASQLSSSLP